MITESLREVKNNLSRVIDGLEQTGAVVITRNGRASAVLLPLEEGADLESLALATSSRFWRLFDRAAASPTWTPLEASGDNTMNTPRKRRATARG